MVPVSSRSESSFILDDNGDVLVDFVGRYEQVEQDFQYVCENLCLDARLEKVNVSRGRPIDYREVHTETTKRITEKMFAADLKLFGYQF